MGISYKFERASLMDTFIIEKAKNGSDFLFSYTKKSYTNLQSNNCVCNTASQTRFEQKVSSKLKDAISCIQTEEDLEYKTNFLLKGKKLFKNSSDYYLNYEEDCYLKFELTKSSTTLIQVLDCVYISCNNIK